MDQSQSFVAMLICIGLALLLTTCNGIKPVEKQMRVVCTTTGQSFSPSEIQYDSNQKGIQYDDFYCQSWHTE